MFAVHCSLHIIHYSLPAFASGLLETKKNDNTIHYSLSICPHASGKGGHGELGAGIPISAPRPILQPVPGRLRQTWRGMQNAAVGGQAATLFITYPGGCPYGLFILDNSSFIIHMGVRAMTITIDSAVSAAQH